MKYLPGCDRFIFNHSKFRSFQYEAGGQYFDHKFVIVMQNESCVDLFSFFFFSVWGVVTDMTAYNIYFVFSKF